MLPKTLLFQGNLDGYNSFSLINKKLTDGLRNCGYTINFLPTDIPAKINFPDSRPDIYIFHGFGYDWKNAPGKVNIFIFNYEQDVIERKYNQIVNRINNYFDVLLVPSHYVKNICRKNGVSIPIRICPWAADQKEFNPKTKPKVVVSEKDFLFIYLGGIFYRKGTDILLKAFRKEFSSKESVALLIKGCGYENALPWAERVIKKAGLKKQDNPKVIFVYNNAPSVAGYFTAADAGVFPHRGEGFGLPILECIASGRQAIVSKGTGPMDYCNTHNSKFIRVKKVISKMQSNIEPCVDDLRRQMRQTFQKGRLNKNKALRISSSVKRFTWDRTLSALHAAIQKCYYKKFARTNIYKSLPPLNPAVGYAYFKKGLTSWKKYCLKVDSILKRSFKIYFPIDFKTKMPASRIDIIIGLSEFCLEQFLRTKDSNKSALCILHQEGTMLQERIKIANGERKKCGVRLIEKAPIELWRNKMECDLADSIIVSSSEAKKYFVNSGYPAQKISVIPYGIEIHKPIFHYNNGKTRFFFVGTDPFRKGIRVLFEAWDALQLKNAELICMTELEVLNSKLLLKYLVRNPNIIIKELAPYRSFLKTYENIDCQILPSFEDSFSFVIADGMGFGKPAIVSNNTGIKDILSHLEDGYIVKTGSVEDLKKAILYFYENKNNIKKMGEAAYETAKKYSWRRFESEFLDLVQSLYARHRAKIREA